MKTLLVLGIAMLVIFGGAWAPIFAEEKGAAPEGEAAASSEAGAKSAEQSTNEPADDQAAGLETSAEEVRKKTRDAYEAAKDYMLQRKKVYEGELNVKLEELNAELARLRQKADEEKPKVEAKVQEQIKQLEQEREEVQERLTKLRKDSSERLRDLRKQMEGAVADLEEYIREMLPQKQGD